jgi:hypothetical protein
MLALAMLVWFASPFTARPAEGAGCHVSERPVLGVHPPGLDAVHVAAWQEPDRGSLAPPVLTRVPCPGETPHAPAISVPSIGPASLATFLRIPEIPDGPSLADNDVESLDPDPLRLDRPPR